MRDLANAIDGVLADGCVLICDRDRKWSRAVLEFLEHEGVRIIRTPFRAPNCNAYAERFVRSIKEECLDRVILLGSDTFDARSPSSSPTTMASGTIKASERVDSAARASGWPRTCSPPPTDRWHVELLLPCRVVQRTTTELSDITGSACR